MISYFLTEGIAIKLENNLIVNSKAEVMKHVSRISFILICLFHGTNLRTVYHKKETKRSVN